MLAILKEAAVPGKNIVFFLDVAYIDYAGEKEEVAKSLKSSPVCLPTFFALSATACPKASLCTVSVLAL